MNWVVRKIDMLLAAVVCTAGGMTFSQAQAFANAYLQRLGGHLDEARLTLRRLQDGEMLATASATVRDEAMREQAARVQELHDVYMAIAGTDPFLRPVMVLRHLDMPLAERTFQAFVPALPLDTAGVVYTFIGVFLGLLLYELIKLPFKALFRPRRRGARKNEAAREGSPGPLRPRQ